MRSLTPHARVTHQSQQAELKKIEARREKVPLCVCVCVRARARIYIYMYGCLHTNKDTCQVREARALRRQQDERERHKADAEALLVRLFQNTGLGAAGRHQCVYEYEYICVCVYIST